MKRSELREIIREALQGYSKYTGKTQGGTSADFMKILTAIAKGEKTQAEKGHDVLDKANPDNVAKILKGEKPVYEAAEKTNLWSKAPIQDLLEVIVWNTGKVSLSIYNTKGELRKRTAAIPLEEFTQEYVEKETSTVYKLSDNFKQGITQFISDVHSLVSSND